MSDQTYEIVEGLDINDTDTVFANRATGRFVKVRVRRVESPRGQWGIAVFEVSGAACGSDGRALARTDGRDGFQIAPAQRLTVQTDRPVDIVAVLDHKRREVAAATERAAEMEAALAPNIA